MENNFFGMGSRIDLPQTRRNSQDPARQHPYQFALAKFDFT